MKTRAANLTTATPPLWIWGVVAGVVVVAFAGYQLFLKESMAANTSAGPSFYSANTERLNEFFDHDGGRSEIKIVTLGTSLMRAATPPFGDDLGTKTVRPDQRLMSQISIFRASARLVDFQPLFDTIIDGKPDIVLVQSDLLRDQPVQENMRALLKRTWRMITSENGSQQTLPLAQAISRQRAQQRYLKCGPNRNNINVRRMDKLERLYRNNSALNDAFIELIKGARARDVQVVVVHLTRQITYRKLYKASLSRWQAGLRASLQKVSEVPFWVSPSDYEKDDYCDLTHLNARGRKKYQNWLAPLVRDLTGTAGTS